MSTKKLRKIKNKKKKTVEGKASCFVYNSNCILINALSNVISGKYTRKLLDKEWYQLRRVPIKEVNYEMVENKNKSNSFEIFTITIIAEKNFVYPIWNQIKIYVS